MKLFDDLARISSATISTHRARSTVRFCLSSCRTSNVCWYLLRTISQLGLREHSESHGESQSSLRDSKKHTTTQSTIEWRWYEKSFRTNCSPSRSRGARHPRCRILVNLSSSARIRSRCVSTLSSRLARARLAARTASLLNGRKKSNTRGRGARSHADASSCPICASELPLIDASKSPCLTLPADACGINRPF